MNRKKNNEGSIALYGCLTVTALAYLGTLDNFLVADSWSFMIHRTFFSNFAYFFKTMLPPEHNAFWLRPIPMFTYWFDMLFWPGTNWGPHLQNILLHLVNTWLIWKIIRIATARRVSSKPDTQSLIPAVTAALVYGLHPLGVGAVAWVAARFDVMSVTFGLSGLLYWLRRDAGDTSGKTLIMSLLFLTLSIFSKEQGIIYAAACFMASLFSAVKSPESRRNSIIGMALIASITVAYIALRFAAFQGIGGYVEARHGLSIMPPVYFSLALLFPYSNVIGGSTITPFFAMSSLAVIALFAYLRKKPGQTSGKIGTSLLISAAAICIFGLATNAPNPGMTLDRILGHAESRFALNAVAGLSLLAGIAAFYLCRKKAMITPIIIVATILNVSAAWRTDAQVQAWDDAGRTAKSIIDNTLRLAPNPPMGSRLIFFDIPRNNEQWAYIFGIGLEEALMLKYKRSDIRIIRYPKRSDLRTARPGVDFVFKYIPSTGTLERLQAKRQTPAE